MTMTDAAIQELVRQEIAAALGAPTVDPLAVTTSGWIADVVPDTPILADWGNSIRNRTVTPFASVAARDAVAAASNAAIPLGSLCVTLDTGQVWHLNDKTGPRRWTPPWELSWGYLGGATSSTTLSGITGAVNIPGIDVTVNTVVNRRLRVVMVIQGIATTVASAGALVSLLQDGAVFHSSGILIPQANVGVQMIIEKDVVPPASGTTRVLGQISSYGGGNATVHNAAGTQFVGASYIEVFDIGPNPNPSPL